MKVEDLKPIPEIKVVFKLSSYKLVPVQAGCYILSTFSDEILYIGLASNLNSRFKQHLENSEKTSPTAEGKAIWFYFKSFDPSNLAKLERTWLNQHSSMQGSLPILNKVNSPLS